jgi:hypothetical protein
MPRLVLCPNNKFTKTLEFIEDRVGRGAPAKVRLWAAWLVSISRFGTPIRARFSTTRAYLTG